MTVCTAARTVCETEATTGDGGKDVSAETCSKSAHRANSTDTLFSVSANEKKCYKLYGPGERPPRPHTAAFPAVDSRRDAWKGDRLGSEPRTEQTPPRRHRRIGKAPPWPGGRLRSFRSAILIVCATLVRH